MTQSQRECLIFHHDFPSLQARQVALCAQTNLSDHSYFLTRETPIETLKRCRALVSCDGALYFAADRRRGVLRLALNCGGASHGAAAAALAAAAAGGSGVPTPLSGPVAAAIAPLEVPLADGLLGYVARKGVSVCIPDAQLDPRFNRQWDLVLGRSTTSLLCVPVADAGASAHDAVGVVLLTNKEGSAAFTEVDRVVVCLLARQMWALLQSRRQSGGVSGRDGVEHALADGVRMLHNTAVVAKGVTRFKQGGRRRSSIVSSLFNDC
jgi:GAF domain-containing protein